MHYRSTSFCGIALMLIAANAGARDTAFDAALFDIIFNNGTGAYAATPVDAPFSGLLSYPDTSGPPDVLEPNEADYKFTGAGVGGTLSDGTTVTNYDEISVNIQNDYPLSPVEAFELGQFLGQQITPGTPVDTWTLAALEEGAFVTPIGDDLVNGLAIEVVLLSLDTSMFDDLDYRPDPPTLAQVDVAILTFDEASSTGTEIYSAFALLDFVGLPAPDSDGDGINDDADNCLTVANEDQRDADEDGIGSVCDADLNNDCSVNFLDLGQIKAVFLSDDSNADFDGSGSVNFVDLGLMKDQFLLPPGPSGVANVCDGR